MSMFVYMRVRVRECMRVHVCCGLYTFCVNECECIYVCVCVCLCLCLREYMGVLVCARMC